MLEERAPPLLSVRIIHWLSLKKDELQAEKKKRTMRLREPD